MKDNIWTFYKDSAGEWRWRLVDAASNKIIGASTEGYKNLSDCRDNARRLGWTTFASTTEEA